MFAIFSDPRVTRYLSRPPWASIDQALERITQDGQALACGKYLCLGLERTSGEELIGECSLFSIHDQSRRAEIGYAMAAGAWGCGYMAEAMTSLLAFGFDELALNRVEADIDPRNAASARSLERLGFKKEGHLRERWIVSGEVSDSDLYGLLFSDWRAADRPAPPARVAR